MNAPLRDNILRSVAEIRIDSLDDLDELDVLLDEIKVAFSKRNKYLHNSWCRHPATGNCYTQTVESRGSLDAALTPVSAGEITAAAMFIYDAGMKLMGFLMHRNLISPFPPAPRQRTHKSKAARKKRRETLLKG